MNFLNIEISSVLSCKIYASSILSKADMKPSIITGKIIKSVIIYGAFELPKLIHRYTDMIASGVAFIKVKSGLNSRIESLYTIYINDITNDINNDAITTTKTLNKEYPNAIKIPTSVSKVKKLMNTLSIVGYTNSLFIEVDKTIHPKNMRSIPIPYKLILDIIVEFFIR